MPDSQPVFLLLSPPLVFLTFPPCSPLAFATQLPVFAAPQPKPKRYELKDLPPPESPEAKDVEIEIVLVG